MSKPQLLAFKAKLTLPTSWTRDHEKRAEGKAEQEMQKMNCKGLYFTLKTCRSLKNFNERSHIAEFGEGYTDDCKD